jgi:hypothetical protein
MPRGEDDRGLRGFVHATVSVGVLVAIAFAAAYHGSRLGPEEPPQPNISGVELSSAGRSPINHNQQSESEQTQPYVLPFTIRIENAPTSKAEAEKDASFKEREQADVSIYNLGVWSIIVGAIQAIALVVTFGIAVFVSIRQLRAYVYPAVRLKKFSLTAPCEVTIAANNAGHTPTREVEIQGVVFIDSLPLPDHYAAPQSREHPSGRHSKSTLYPGSEISADLISVDLLTPHATARLTTLPIQTGMFAAGSIHYRDIFGLKRVSTFRWFVESQDMLALIADAQANQLQATVNAQFSATHILNDFT